jgi:AraC family transcriptional regulator
MADASNDTHHLISRPQFEVRHTSASRCEFQPHSHRSYTVTTILSGFLQAEIGEERLRVDNGETAFTGIGITHSAIGAPVEFISVAIGTTFMVDLTSELGMVSRGNEIVFRGIKVEDPWIASTAKALAVEAATARVGQGAMLDALVRQLGVHLLRNHIAVRRSPQIETSRAGPVDRRIRLALEFIHDNYSRDLAVEEIAAAAYLSEFHFARLFKRITGIAPHAYLANIRIEHARRLLHDTSSPISEVAAAVGYESQSHFTRLFKAATGLTPRAFRNGMRETIEE